MIFHAIYEYSTDNRDQVHERFKQTGGAAPPEVSMLGRWHSTEGNGGFLVAESDDAEAVAKWLQDWTDLVSFEITPVLTDEQFASVIG
jgi:hypothetical protein